MEKSGNIYRERGGNTREEILEGKYGARERKEIKEI